MYFNTVNGFMYLKENKNEVKKMKGRGKKRKNPT